MTYRILMDCDPGIDDACALSCALTDPEISLELITTVAGNVTVDKTTKNALRLVEFFNKDVPVAAGARKPLLKQLEDASEVHGESGIDGYDFDEPSIKPFSDDAVSILKDKLLHSNVPLTIIATGSFTNLGLLLSLYPEVKPKIKEFILMGGSLAQGNMTSVAEFNVFTDPHAARIVFSSGIKTTMIGLDCTLFGRISDNKGTTTVFVPAVICFAVSYAIIATARTLPTFLVAAIVGACGFGICAPLLQALTFKMVPQQRAGAASNTTYVGLDLGNLLGPSLAGILVDFLAPVSGNELAAYSDMWLALIVPIVAGLVFYLSQLKKIRHNIEKMEASRS